MASPKNVAEPHKELRFTRAGQAQGFYIAGAVFIALTTFILITWLMGHPSFRWWMLPLPAAISYGLIHLALHCTRHAYLILTPLGVEVFPLWKPEKNLLLIYWTEIQSAEVENHLLKLHRNQEKTSGVVISIKPILEYHRPLLTKAIKGRMTED
ncbi:hypothetical protein N9F50_00085 [Akkermansiaceae bacterium]|nr:hypothetical protein [Akkermansiaceae bacterium]